MKETLEKILKEINDDDKKAMFGVTSNYMITRDLDIAQDKLLEYSEYDVPVCLGDIIEIDKNKYVVTCVYTDNSVDLLDDTAHKKNMGLYKKDVKIVGKLDVIQEG